jgi:ATP synthase protein I
MAGARNKSGRNGSDRDGQEIRRRLDDLGSKLDAVRGRRQPAQEPTDQGRGAALGQALRLATELIAGVVVGGFIGWVLDRAFGSAPFLLVAFLILGATAGILNVVRAAKAMQAKAPPVAAQDLPRVIDDDDD